MDWISIENQYPKCSSTVRLLVDGKMILGFYDQVSSNMGDFYDAETGYIVEKVTHWTPFSEPPNELD